MFDRSQIKTFKFSWWKRILFRFIKPQIGFDLGSDKDKSVVMVFKRWRGATYLVDEYEVGKNI